MSAATRTQVRHTEQQNSLPELSMRTSSCAVSHAYSFRHS